jgi:hypothetical protein
MCRGLLHKHAPEVRRQIICPLFFAKINVNYNNNYKSTIKKKNMNILTGMDGLKLSLGVNDRRLIETQGFVAKTIPDWRRIVFRVREHAEPDADQLKFYFYEHPPNPWLSQPQTEPGWWIETIPDRGYNEGVYSRSVQDRISLEGLEPLDRDYSPITLFMITIDNRRWRELLSEGYIATRSLFDRIDVTYWEEGMKPVKS